jgi:hypothetical protein
MEAKTFRKIIFYILIGIGALFVGLRNGVPLLSTQVAIGLALLVIAASADVWFRRSPWESKEMPRGPKGEKRPADAIGNAVMIGRIATGEIEDVTTEDGKNAAAVALGRMGGKARAAGMSAKKRSEIAKKAALKRWRG